METRFNPVDTYNFCIEVALLEYGSVRKGYLPEPVNEVLTAVSGESLTFPGINLNERYLYCVRATICRSDITAGIVDGLAFLEAVINGDRRHILTLLTGTNASNRVESQSPSNGYICFDTCSFTVSQTDALVNFVGHRIRVS